jgi:ADP-dependent NAD(P)H-hydrate dehydratase / NAD(P)H-hydrate epimerase
MKLLTAAEMREIDRRTIEEIGLPGVVLMENAGRAAADAVAAAFSSCRPGPVLVLAGRGNNGGDGYVVARHLHNRGWHVITVVLATEEQITGDAALQLRVLSRGGGTVHFAGTSAALATFLAEQRPRLLVDALLGTGLNSTVRGLIAEAIDWINGAALPVIALDIPSGVDASNGRVLGRAVRADLTVTFAFAKIGHAVHPGAGLTGELVTADIGIPLALTSQADDSHLLVDAEDARRLLPARPVTGHKGSFGHLLVIAGCRGKSGAAVMAAEGGLRSGAGLVTVACPESIQTVLAVKLTEAMTVALPENGGMLRMDALALIENLWSDKKAIALGPGLGVSADVCELVRSLVRNCPMPLVLDADGLNAIADAPAVLLERRGPPAILTPHPGEMARLIGGSVAQVEDDRLGAARDFARQYQVVLVLKGARTVIAFPDGRVRINSTGHPGMASGGTGDVLTGVIGGLLAQGLSPEDAATLGVFLHGLAGDSLRGRLGEAGMIATDLLRELPVVRNQLIQSAP